MGSILQTDLAEAAIGAMLRASRPTTEPSPTVRNLRATRSLVVTFTSMPSSGLGVAYSPSRQAVYLIGSRHLGDERVNPYVKRRYQFAVDVGGGDGDTTTGT